MALLKAINTQFLKKEKLKIIFLQMHLRGLYLDVIFRLRTGVM